MENLYQKSEQLKEKLNKQRIFSQDHRKAIPRFPKKIATLIADTGAAIEDIHTTTDSRYPLVEKISISILVQGINAKNDIVEKIKYADTLRANTIILGRGGGSIEDLWNFNEEEVVRAIYECHTPIILAVGHETDLILSDFVADIRAATPTQAAVIATPDQYELIQQIHQYRFSLTRGIKQLTEKQHKQLDYLSPYYKFKQPTSLYEQQIQQRNDLEKKLTQRLTLNIEKKRNNIIVLRQHFNIRRLSDPIVQYQKMIRDNGNRLIDLTYNLINRNKANLKNKIEQLNQLSPTNTMLRGHSIINKDNKVVTSTHDLDEQDEIALSMKDGNIDAIARKVRCEDE